MKKLVATEDVISGCLETNTISWTLHKNKIFEGKKQWFAAKGMAIGCECLLVFSRVGVVGVASI